MKSRFARIPARAIGCRELSARDWQVLACIALHCNRGGGAFPGMTRIAAMTGIRRGDIPRSISRLERAGLLRREHQPTGQGWDNNRYTLIFDDADRVSADLRTGVRNAADRVPADLRIGCPQKRTPSVRNAAYLTDRTDQLTDSVHRIEGLHVNGNEAAGWFEKFWEAYPSRQQHSNPKKPARQKFEKLVKGGIDPRVLITAAKDYGRQVERQGTDPRFVPQAVTWLNQERFADEPRVPKQQQLFAGGMI